MATGRNPCCPRVLCLLIAIAAPSACAQSIDEVIQRALSTNRDYLASVQRVRQAEALLRQAGVRPAPTIEGEGGSTRLLGSPGSQEYSIGYFHPVETGGKRSKRVEVARLGVQLAQAEADEKRRQLTFEVRQRYAETVNARSRLAVLADVTRINDATLRLIAARVEEGDAAPLERRLLEIDINRTEVDRVMLEARGEAALLDLKRIGALVGSDTALTPESGAAPALPSRDDLVRLAILSRSDLRALRVAEEQARSGIELAQADSSPNITASARYAYRRTTFDQFGFDSAGALTPVRDRESLLAFGVSVPLFTRRKNQSIVEVSVAREREARLRREYLRSAIPFEVSAALRKWDAARRAVDAFERNVLHQSEQNLSVIKQAWQLGQLRFIDVLNEQRRLTDLRLARADAEADLMKAWAELAHAVGGDIR